MVSCCSCHSPVLFGVWRNVNAKGAHKIKAMGSAAGSWHCQQLWEQLLEVLSCVPQHFWWSSSLQGLGMLFGLQPPLFFPRWVCALAVSCLHCWSFAPALTSCCPTVTQEAKSTGWSKLQHLQSWGFSSCLLYSGSREMGFFLGKIKTGWFCCFEITFSGLQRLYLFQCWGHAGEPWRDWVQTDPSRSSCL